MDEQPEPKKIRACPAGPAPAGMDILAKIKAEQEAAKEPKPETKTTKKSGK